jgi:DHA1 family bicyclomycin/chloramphenicol resistance-like MFS transporter
MLGVTLGLFAVLFGVNALGFVGAAQLNRLLLRRLSMMSVIQGAVTAAVLIGIGLLVVVASGHASTLTLTVLCIGQAATVGATLPNITALAFGCVRERMGGAAALQGTAQSIVAGSRGGWPGRWGTARRCQ